MKTSLLRAVLASLLLITLFGCGSSSDDPRTRGKATVYLFGSMSSVSRVTSVKSSIPLPEGVMVNYSTPAGATLTTPGTYPLRSGTIVPSGPVLFTQSDIQSAECTVATDGTRKITFQIFNTPDLNSNGAVKNIRSSTVGNGTEIATINFQLKAVEVLPTLPDPWSDTAAEIGVNLDTRAPLNIFYPTGLKLNYSASFFP